MPVEIDETQLASLQNTAKIVQGMLKNPKTRLKVLEAYKENNPEAAVPEIDTAAPFMDRIGKLEEGFTTFIKEFREDREKEKTEGRLSEIKKQMEDGRKMLRERGYTPEGITKLEEFRDGKGLVDYNDAVRLFELDNPPPQIAEPTLTGMNMFDIVRNDIQNTDNANDFHKRLYESMGEDNSAVDRAAMQAIAEMRGASRR